MKVAYLLGSLSRGGTETLLLDIFRNPEKASYSFIGIHRKGGDLESDFQKSNSSFFHLSPKFPFDPFYLYRLRRLLNKNDIAIVHAQQSIDALYAVLALLGTSVKVIQTFHGYDIGYGLYARAILKWSMKIVALNLFVSRTQQNYYQQKYSLKDDQCEVVYNGVSFEKLNHYERMPIRAEFSIDESSLLLGTVGNFVVGRDQYTICRFLKLLKEKGIKYKFLFVGKASNNALYRPCVDYCHENDLDENVIFVGSRTDVPNILHQLDAFVYASDHDTFGIAVIEAIAAGVPTFVNDWGVMREITNDGKYATLYKTKDIHDLLVRFMTYLDQKDIYREKSKVLASEIREKFSIETHLNKLYSVYKSINSAS